MQACRNSFAGSASSHLTVGSAGLILELAYRRSSFYRQFAATHGGTRRALFR
jgi:hypothetical protein